MIYLDYLSYLCITLYINYARMGLAGDLRELLLPRLCPVCGKLMVRGEDVLCAFCAIGLPRCRFGRLNNNDDVNDDVNDGRCKREDGRGKM